MRDINRYVGEVCILCGHDGDGLGFVPVLTAEGQRAPGACGDRDCARTAVANDNVYIAAHWLREERDLPRDGLAFGDRRIRLAQLEAGNVVVDNRDREHGCNVVVAAAGGGMGDVDGRSGIVHNIVVNDIDVDGTRPAPVVAAGFEG